MLSVKDQQSLKIPHLVVRMANMTHPALGNHLNCPPIFLEEECGLNITFIKYTWGVYTKQIPHPISDVRRVGRRHLHLRNFLGDCYAYWTLKTMATVFFFQQIDNTIDKSLLNELEEIFLSYKHLCNLKRTEIWNAYYLLNNGMLVPLCV